MSNKGNELMPKASTEKFNFKDSVCDQLEVLDNFKAVISNGDIQSFIVIGVDQERQIVLASYGDDIIEGVGILETAKFAYLRQQSEG
jgi:hypothetical protein